VHELAGSVGEDVEHPLLRKVTAANRTDRIVLIVISSNRGLAGAYNGNVLRAAAAFIRRQEAEGKTVELHLTGKKGAAYFTFQKRPIAGRLDQADTPVYADIQRLADTFMRRFTAGEIDAVYVAYMNFISTSTQKPDVMLLLPLGGVREAADHVARQAAEKEAQMARGALDAKHTGADVELGEHAHSGVIYDFSPDPASLLGELLPLTVKTALFQAYLDAYTSENVARMVAMKSATDNADKMVKSLTMQYNRARQSQITTELSEIMGGAEALKS
jgi:F-type H+-transporting ATPase subunit gamma